MNGIGAVAYPYYFFNGVNSRAAITAGREIRDLAEKLSEGAYVIKATEIDRAEIRMRH